MNSMGRIPAWSEAVNQIPYFLRLDRIYLKHYIWEQEIHLGEDEIE